MDIRKNIVYVLLTSEAPKSKEETSIITKGKIKIPVKWNRAFSIITDFGGFFIDNATLEKGYY
tara:strand:+ start:556 stop:744 length:189 start_codon:yes stop_codon:yes gene_type:complete